MKIIQVEKPVIQERTAIGKKFDELMAEVDTPILNWCREQEIKRKNKKW